MMIVLRWTALLIGLWVSSLAGPGIAAPADDPAEGDDGVTLNLDALDQLRPDKAEAPPADKTESTRVTFPAGKAEPTSKGRAAAEALARDKKDTKSRFTIVAYAAPGAGENDNDNDARRLALRRAINLRQILVAGGIEGTRVNLQPKGPRPEGTDSDAADIVVTAP